MKYSTHLWIYQSSFHLFFRFLNYFYLKCFWKEKQWMEKKTQEKRNILEKQNDFYFVEILSIRFRVKFWLWFSWNSFVCRLSLLSRKIWKISRDNSVFFFRISEPGVLSTFARPPLQTQYWNQVQLWNPNFPKKCEM